MKTIEEKAEEFAEDNWLFKERGLVKVVFKAAYAQAMEDNEHLLCEIDNLHNLTFWLRLQICELIIGRF